MSKKPDYDAEARGLEEFRATGQMDGIIRRMRDVRRLRGVSQARAAQHMRLQRTAYNAVEAGRQQLTLWQFLRFADALSIRIDWLMTGHIPRERGTRFVPDYAEIDNLWEGNGDGGTTGTADEAAAGTAGTRPEGTASRPAPDNDVSGAGAAVQATGTPVPSNDPAADATPAPGGAGRSPSDSTDGVESMLPEIREMDPEETHRPTYPAKPRKRAAAGKGKRAAAVAARKPKKKKKGGKHA